MPGRKELKTVIQCMPDGTVEMTLKDKELKPFVGHRTIKRMSEVLFNEDTQRFYVKFKYNGITTPAIFETYEDAVAYEIAKINEQRKTGIKLNALL